MLKPLVPAALSLMLLGCGQPGESDLAPGEVADAPQLVEATESGKLDAPEGIVLRAEYVASASTDIAWLGLARLTIGGASGTRRSASFQLAGDSDVEAGEVAFARDADKDRRVLYLFNRDNQARGKFEYIATGDELLLKDASWPSAARPVRFERNDFARYCDLNCLKALGYATFRGEHRVTAQTEGELGSLAFGPYDPGPGPRYDEDGQLYFWRADGQCRASLFPQNVELEGTCELRTFGPANERAFTFAFSGTVPYFERPVRVLPPRVDARAPHKTWYGVTVGDTLFESAASN